MVRKTILILLISAFTIILCSSGKNPIYASSGDVSSDIVGSSKSSNMEKGIYLEYLQDLRIRENLNAYEKAMGKLLAGESNEESNGEPNGEPNIQLNGGPNGGPDGDKTAEANSGDNKSTADAEATGATEDAKKVEESEESEESEEANAVKEVKLLLSFAGDCTIGTDESFAHSNTFTEVFKRQNYDYSYFFSGVKQIFESDDLTLVNLETTLTEAVKKADKKFRFKGKPDYVNILKAGSIEMVNISNNHIYDYLQQGFDETLQSLKAANILYSGEGHIAYYSTKGKTIASLGFNGWDLSIKKRLKEDIQKAREVADMVVVSFHWGKERSYYPLAVQTELGRFSIDSGADIVVGHHPHVIQGIELYKGKYIVYSLGNFCFGGNSNPADKDSMIFRSEFTFMEDKLTGVKGEIIPCSISSVSHINDYRPVVLDSDRGQKVLERIYKYSSSLKYGIKPGSLVNSK